MAENKSESTMSHETLDNTVLVVATDPKTGITNTSLSF